MKIINYNDFMLAVNQAPPKGCPDHQKWKGRPFVSIEQLAPGRCRTNFLNLTINNIEYVVNKTDKPSYSRFNEINTFFSLICGFPAISRGLFAFTSLFSNGFAAGGLL